MTDSASRPLAGSAPEHQKEVAQMINMTPTMKAQSPSFGVPAFGPASYEVRGVAAVAGVEVSTCARIRHIGGMQLVTTTGDFPGTSAWRPPTC
jgi:hypothetical protein